MKKLIYLVIVSAGVALMGMFTFFLPKSTFKEMYINNCIIIKKK